MLARRWKGGYNKAPVVINSRGYVYASAPHIYDFKLGVAPPGIIEFPGVGPDHRWDTTDGLVMNASANDVNNAAAYPIRLDAAFSGDWLFQVSTRIDMDPSGSNYCSDAGIALFDSPPSGRWEWQWSQHPGRIAAQNNCKNPTLYGQTDREADYDHALTLDGVWVTMHLFHFHSSRACRYDVTEGFEDWERTSPLLKSRTLRDESFGEDYYCGLASDDDDDDMFFSAFRISPL